MNQLFNPNSSRSMSESKFLSLELKDCFIIDVRNSFELSSGSLECAHNIPFSELLSRINELPKDKIILTYCNYGNRAGQAANSLFQSGIDAYSLGGYSLFSDQLKNKCKK